MSNPSDPYLVPDSMPPGESGTSGKAIASLILGLGSIPFSIFLAIPGLILGLMGLGDINRSQGRLGGRNMATAGVALSIAIPLLQLCIVIPILLLLPAIQAARAAASRAKSSMQLKNIATAAHMHHDNFQQLPLAVTSPKGAPVSWRTKLLPYVEQGHLFDSYDFTQPWDSGANQRISGRTVEIYRNPNDKDPASVKTNYLAVVGPGTMLAGNEPVSFNSIKAPSQTIMFVEADADHAVPWAQPKDLDYDPNDPKAGLGGYRPGGFIAVFGGTEVKFIKNDVDPAVLKAMMSRDASDDASVPIGPIR